ncbi:hypothetical protein P7F88_25455 [Vibrio hannami]|uniref:hypothetical protein n=1 Tax=Vibrio hannami TaxID=2717094 RepID=UPI00240F42EF|nr:hypothetical protein [Vibrio hannami]MDG3089213.1 hypothetical protein [Vibrio hannami]
MSAGFKDDDSKAKRAGKLAFNSTAAIFLPASALFLGQFLNGMLRDAIFNSEEWEKQEEEGTLEEWLAKRALDRTGFTGRLKPLINVGTGIRYETDSTSLFAGTYASYFARNMDKMIKPAVSDRNSEKTNTDERAMRLGRSIRLASSR